MVFPRFFPPLNILFHLLPTSYQLNSARNNQSLPQRHTLLFQAHPWLTVPRLFKSPDIPPHQWFTKTTPPQPNTRQPLIIHILNICLTALHLFPPNITRTPDALLNLTFLGFLSLRTHHQLQPSYLSHVH